MLLLVEKCIFKNKPTLILYMSSGISKRSYLCQVFTFVHPRQEPSYGGVKENGSPVGGAVCGCLGGVAL